MQLYVEVTAGNTEKKKASLSLEGCISDIVEDGDLIHFKR